MIRQSKTTIKELSAQYRSVLRRAFVAGIIAIATANSANATITAGDISDINDSINMVQSDGNYTTSMGSYNVATTDYSTADGYGLYTYDHDNNPETPEIPLTTNDGSETLDNSLFTYTDNHGATTNLADNSTGFTTSDFTNAAGTIDVADGTTDLTILQANTTSVGLSNYQYKANFDNSVDALTALTADAPELGSFHNDITLTTGSITVNGNNEVNKPSIEQYGFTVDLHDGSTGNFDLVYNESTHLYSYNYNGDVVLDAADIAAADAQVASKSADLIADTTLFNNAVTTNTNNYNSAVGHYNAVHGVYESDANAQSALNTGYDNYVASFATAQANQSAAASNLSDAQNAYADDLAIYNPVATAYNNYENSLGKSIDAKDAMVLADAATDAANKANTAEQNAKTYADSLASNYDAAGTAATEATRAQGEEAAIRGEFAAADTTLQANISAETTRATAAEGALDTRLTSAEGTIATHTTDIAANTAAISAETTRATAAEGALNLAITNEATARANGDVATLSAANSYTDSAIANANVLMLKSANNYTDERVDNLEKEMSAGIASATALSAVAVPSVKKGQLAFSGGYGYYNSQSAVALGATMGLSDKWSVNVGTGISDNNASFRAGTTYILDLF